MSIIDILPFELFYYNINSYLDPKSLCNFISSTKYFEELKHDNQYWINKIINDFNMDKDKLNFLKEGEAFNIYSFLTSFKADEKYIKNLYKEDKNLSLNIIKLKNGNTIKVNENKITTFNLNVESLKIKVDILTFDRAIIFKDKFTKEDYLKCENGIYKELANIFPRVIITFYVKNLSIHMLLLRKKLRNLGFDIILH